MRLAMWSLRLVVAVLLSALLLAALVVGMAPRVWGMLNSHQETAISLYEVGGFTGLAERSVVFDARGRQIGVFQAENSQQTLISEIPGHVVDALLSIEDRTFRQHKGVDLRAVGRQVITNVNEGSSGGASTITQQVVKNELLATLPRDGRYKLLQMRYAILLERELTKDQILERWFNTNFYGYNAYGIKAAAEVYFGKDVSDLSLEEGTFLVGLVRAPSAYDPINNRSLSLSRFVTALRRVRDEGYITLTDDELVRRAAAVLPTGVRSRPDEPVQRTHFTELVKDYLLNQTTILGTTYQERYAKLFRGGLRIYTTLDRDVQASADDAVTLLPDNSVNAQAALVTVDNATGAIRAMVGGKPFKAGENEVNLAMRRRQTGSSVKMFILAAALEAGVEADDYIDGTLPCTLPNPENPEEPFIVKNGVSEPVGSLRRMTWLSINCAYAKLSQIVGLNRVVDRIYQMSSSEWLTPEEYPVYPYASLATGANELSVVDMAAGAQTLANLGVHHEPYFLEKILERDNNTLVWERQVSVEGTEALTTVSAAKTVDIMKGVLKGGTARRTALADDRPAAGKTGTQARNTNAWFVGFTPQYSTVVWVGDPRGYTQMAGVPEFRGQIVGQWGFSRNTVTGATYPAHIWKQHMDTIHSGLEVVDWGTRKDEQWKALLTPQRGPARLYLPGVECVAQVISGTPPAPSTTLAPGRTTTTTVDPAAGTEPTLVPAPVVVSVLPTATTIDPAEKNPYAPVPSVPIAGHIVYDCDKGVPNWTQTTVVGG
ncbi:MAG: transglycosylase domain-containing protein [Ilumatobacteraceae bacterium]